MKDVLLRGGSNLEFRNPGHRHRIPAFLVGLDGRFHVEPHVFDFRSEDEFRLGNLIPGQFLAAIAGQLAHDGGQRAGNHVVAAVDGIARSDRRKQGRVFEVVGISAAAAVTPVASRPIMRHRVRLHCPLVPIYTLELSP